MEMKMFQLMATKLSPKIAIRIRGRHGIGKSEAVYQVGKKLGLQVVERRLSQIQEGDLCGLPQFTGEGKFRSTEFYPCTWLIDCCNNPRLLFLDELNRSLPAVEQATFQLADSRRFYGNDLHPETRIIIAENVGDQYQVTASDPAAISRYAVVDLEPSIDEWLEFAQDHCHPALVEFIRANPRALEYDGVYENNKKYPDRRAWHRLDAELQRAGLMDETNGDGLFYAMCMSMVGVESASAYTKFVSSRDAHISAMDVLESWTKAKKKMGRATNEKYVDIVGKLGDWLKNNKLVKDQAIEIAKCMEDAPCEIRMSIWNELCNNTDNQFMIHPLVKKLILDTVLSAEFTSKNEAEAQKESNP